eukprot:1857775-Amphidinium_carterae.1
MQVRVSGRRWQAAQSVCPLVLGSCCCGACTASPVGWGAERSAKTLGGVVGPGVHCCASGPQLAIPQPLCLGLKKHPVFRTWLRSLISHAR